MYSSPSSSSNLRWIFKFSNIITYMRGILHAQPAALMARVRIKSRTTKKKKKKF